MKISDAATAVIGTFNFEKTDATKVEKTVLKYTRESTFCGTLSYLAGRVWNAIKWICGNSDWQVALKDMKAATLKTLQEKAKIYDPASKDDSDKALNTEIVKLTEAAVESWLTKALEAQGQEKAPDAKDLADIGYDKLIADIKKAEAEMNKKAG